APPIRDRSQRERETATQAVDTNPFADQAYVYKRCGRPVVQAALDGYNVCIFAYGQTGAGKTHTMFGTEEDPGLCPRLIGDLFREIDSNASRGLPVKTTVSCSFFEIY